MNQDPYRGSHKVQVDKIIGEGTKVKVLPMCH